MGRGKSEAEAHGDRRDVDVGSGKARSRAGRRGGSPATAVGNKPSEGGAGQTSACGSGFSMKQSTAELSGMALQREGDGGRGGDERRRRLRSVELESVRGERG